MSTLNSCKCGNTYARDYRLDAKVCTECQWKANGHEVTYDYNVCDVDINGVVEFWSESPAQALRALQDSRKAHPRIAFHVVAYPQYREPDGTLVSTYLTHRVVNEDHLRTQIAKGL